MASPSKTPTTVSTVTPGHVIGGCFGMAFVIANSAPMPSILRAAFVTTAIAIMVLTLFAFGRAVGTGAMAGPRGSDERFDRGYWVIVAIEAIALFGGLTVLNQRQPSAAVGWIAFVVGVHFFWLARRWTSGSREIAQIALALTVLGAAGLLIAFTAGSPDAVALFSGVGSGAVLLISSLRATLKSQFGATPLREAATSE